MVHGAGRSAAMTMRAYADRDAAAWDRLIEYAPGGTVLHSRRFLDYHGSRFAEQSLVWQTRGSSDFEAVLPAVAAPQDPTLVVSHLGSSFGGIIGRHINSDLTAACLNDAAWYFHERGFTRLLMRLAPSVLLRQPDDSALASLLRLGRVTRVDLWSVLRLTPSGKWASYLKRLVRRGQRKGLSATPIETPDDWARAHALITDRLHEKYSTRPVHSVAELVDLHTRLGAQSRGLLIRDGSGVEVAALWCIDYGTGTLHNQYIAATDWGRSLGGGSFGLGLLADGAASEGFHQFSFGHSTDSDDWSVNRSLQEFKSRFGAGLAAQFQIEISLE